MTSIDDEIRRQLHKHFSPRRDHQDAEQHGEEPTEEHAEQQTASTEPASEEDNMHPAGNEETTGKTISLFYKGNMSTAYETDEKTLRDIVSRNCMPTNPQDNIKLTIYYKSPKVSGLIIKNNLSTDNSPLKANDVVYQFKCPFGDCARRSNATYIGHTTTSLSRRITMHLQDGAPKRHVEKDHKAHLTRAVVVENTTILAKCSKRWKLKVLEAVYIRDRDPVINRQSEMRGTLQLCDGQKLAPRQ